MRISDWSSDVCSSDLEPLLFVGHYWRRGRPGPLRDNLACLDYSAVKNGKLVAYRLDSETRLDPAKFVWVDVQAVRSEERRVGKECVSKGRSRSSPSHSTKKTYS